MTILLFVTLKKFILSQTGEQNFLRGVLQDNLKATKKIQYHKNNIFVHMHDVSYNRKPHSIESTDKSNLNNTKQISQISQNDIFIQINHTMIKKLTF